MIITIDGPSGTGKSTVAKAVAKRLQFTFFDTGAMYRSFTWQILQKGIDPSDVEKVTKSLLSFQFEIHTDPLGERSYFVDNVNVTESIRSREISSVSSQIAIYPNVRKAMVKMQRKFGRSCNAVFEGRDMGTVVFPDADLKIFLTAKPTVRAERRYQELLEKFPDLSEPLTQEQILQEMAARDQNDTTRSISPLKQADDAILIDTSNLTIDEVVKKILRLKPKLKRRFPPMKLSYRFVYSLARLFFKICFRLSIYGTKHFRPGPGLIIANHNSFYDPPVLSISCPEEVHFLAKESLFHIPLLGRLIKILNTHPVSRGASDIHVLKQMIQLLNEGKKLIVFPEGKRSIDGTLHPFERGLSFLAQKAKCPIFPAYLSGTLKAWPSKKKWPRVFGKISCVFGSPIEWDDFEDLPKKEAEELLTKRCETSVLSLKDWLEQGANGDPP